MGKITLPGLISAYYSTKESLLRGVLHPKGRHKCLCFPLVSPRFLRLWIWTAVPLKNPSFSLVFIDARRDGLVVHPGQREREREEEEEEKHIRGKGWKSQWTCALMGEQFLPNWPQADRSSMLRWSTARLIYEEMKRETRELEVARTQIDEERWREEKNKVEDMSHLHRSLPRLYFFLNEYLQSSFSFTLPSFVTLEVFRLPSYPHPSLLYTPSVCSKWF